MQHPKSLHCLCTGTQVAMLVAFCTLLQNNQYLWGRRVMCTLLTVSTIVMKQQNTMVFILQFSSFSRRAHSLLTQSSVSLTMKGKHNLKTALGGQEEKVSVCRMAWASAKTERAVKINSQYHQREGGKPGKPDISVAEGRWLDDVWLY